jgi:hypothetical protein
MDDTTSEQRKRPLHNKSGAVAVPRTAAMIVIGAMLILGIEAGLLRRFL